MAVLRFGSLKNCVCAKCDQPWLYARVTYHAQGWFDYLGIGKPKVYGEHLVLTCSCGRELLTKTADA